MDLEHRSSFAATGDLRDNFLGHYNCCENFRGAIDLPVSFGDVLLKSFLWHLIKFALVGFFCILFVCLFCLPSLSDMLHLRFDTTAPLVHEHTQPF